MKKCLKSFIASSLIFGLTISNLSGSGIALAADRFPNQYQSGNYVFEKISHPDKPTKTPDGIVDYIGNGQVSAQDNAQGDRGQSYSWASVAYGDYVYVGTCYAAMGNTLQLMDSVLGDSFDKEVMEATLNALFNGTFFYGQEDNVDSGGILVKVNVHTGEVTLLMSKAMNNQSPLFRNAICYNDKLYFCGSVNATGVALPSIYEVDPATDAIRCVYTGITVPEYAQAFREGICTGIRGMSVHDDRLVVSCVGLNGPYIMISSDPSSGDFKKIASKEDLFNYPAYHYNDSIYGGSIWEIISYNDCLYVALCTGTPDNKPDENTMQSFAIVKGEEHADGTWKWTSLVGDKEKDNARYTFGIDPSRTRAGACHMVVYNDHLYIGEYEDIEIALENVLFKKDFRFLAANLAQSVSVYRMDKNENIELVVGDTTEMFPVGSLSQMGSGFGRKENQYIWQSAVFDGKLFLSTFDSSSLLEPVGQFTNGDLIHNTCEEWKSQLNYIKVLVELLIQKELEKVSPVVDAIEEKEIIEDAAAPDEGSPAENEVASPDETPVDKADVVDEEPADEAEIAAEAYIVDEQSEAYQLVEQAIQDANARMQNSSSSFYNGDVEEITLTADQKEQLVSDLIAGEIVPESLAEENSDELLSINQNLDFCLRALDEAGSEEFAELYEVIYQSLENIAQQIPESLKELYDSLITLFAKDNLKAFVDILKCLSKATRGFDLYTSNDGVHFNAVTINGFNDPYNHGLRTFAFTDTWMVVGTANPFNGTQLWKLTSSKKPVTEKYTLTFESNGGSSIDSLKLDAGTNVDLSQYVPVKDNCTFAGWYEDAELTKNVSDIVLMKDTTVYAKWTEEKTDVTDPKDPEKPEKPAKPSDSNKPEKPSDNTNQKNNHTGIFTGDQTNILGWIALLALSVCFIGIIFFRRKSFKK